MEMQGLSDEDLVAVASYLRSHAPVHNPVPPLWCSFHPMPLTPGTRLGTCEINAPLGAGGMGEVYRARDAGVALARVSTHLNSNHGDPSWPVFIRKLGLGSRLLV